MVTRYPIDWHPVRALPIADTGNNKVLTNRPCRLYGFNFVESTGSAAAACRLVDGGDINGAAIAEISLTPGQSVRDWFGQPGILVESGLTLWVLSGGVRGTVWPLLLTEEEILKDLRGGL